MPIEPRVPLDEAASGATMPSPDDPATGRDRGSIAVDTVFAPQDGLSGFVPQVIREVGTEDGDAGPA